MGFYAAFPNPVATYFEHQVQKIMVNLAISTHRKAIGEAIYKIAQAYLKLQAQRNIVAAQKELLPVGKELISYWQQVESVEGRQGVSLNLATQHQRELELTVEKTTMEEIMQRTQLKILAGVEPQQRLNVDTGSADGILAGFDGHGLKWEERWPATEDDLLLRAQVKLGDYNIMVAWAQYIPDMSIQINNSPPAGQYQPVSGQEDTFLHLTFDFPLLDWGRPLSRRADRPHAEGPGLPRNGPQTHGLFQYLAAGRAARGPGRNPAQVGQDRFGTAELQYKEARISFNEGTEQLPVVAERQEAMTNARIAYIEAELEYKLANLEWMYVANLLQERFLGLPAKEFM